jgi:GT2 family glycosyltransferase
MTTPIKCAVVIPTWKRVKQLTDLLDALRNQVQFPNEVIVACRHDDAESIKKVIEWPHYQCKIAYVYDAGHLPPLLAALKICESEVYCLIDDDAIPDRSWVQRITKHFSDPHIGCIGGRINMYEAVGKNNEMVKISNFVPGRMSWYGRSYHHLPANLNSSNLYDADCFGGSNMAFRTCILESAIDMTLNLGTGAKYETDIALNIREMGYRVAYDPQLVVDHYAAPRAIAIERGYNSKQCHCYAHNLTYLCLKHLRWYGKAAFLVYFFLGGQWPCPAPLTYLLGLLNGNKITFKDHLSPSMRGRFEGIKSYIHYLAKTSSSSYKA